MILHPTSARSFGLRHNRRQEHSLRSECYIVGCFGVHGRTPEKQNCNKRRRPTRPWGMEHRIRFQSMNCEGESMRKTRSVPHSMASILHDIIDLETTGYVNQFRPPPCGHNLRRHHQKHERGTSSMNNFWVFPIGGRWRRERGSLG